MTKYVFIIRSLGKKLETEFPFLIFLKNKGDGDAKCSLGWEFDDCKVLALESFLEVFSAWSQYVFYVIR